MYLVYHDTRWNRDSVDVYLAKSQGGGAGFPSSHIKVNSISSDPNVKPSHTEYIGVAAAAGYVHPLWADLRHCMYSEHHPGRRENRCL